MLIHDVTCGGLKCFIILTLTSCVGVSGWDLIVLSCCHHKIEKTKHIYAIFVKGFDLSPQALLVMLETNVPNDYSPNIVIVQMGVIKKGVGPALSLLRPLSYPGTGSCHQVIVDT